MRASGSGGQSVNMNRSQCQLTFYPLDPKKSEFVPDELRKYFDPNLNLPGTSAIFKRFTISNDASPKYTCCMKRGNNYITNLGFAKQEIIA